MVSPHQVQDDCKIVDNRTKPEVTTDFADDFVSTEYTFTVAGAAMKTMFELGISALMTFFKLLKTIVGVKMIAR